MTSLQRDPRKQYVLDKRNCKDLSITQKLYHPECRKEASVELPINPKPKPQPQPPKPKPSGPNIPDLPPVPRIPYTFQTPSDFNFSPTAGGINPALIAGVSVAGAGMSVLAGRAVYRLGRPPQAYTRYSRVPTLDPDRPSAGPRPADEINFRGGEGEAEPAQARSAQPRFTTRSIDEQAPRSTESRLTRTNFPTTRDTPSSSGLRNRRLGGTDRFNYGNAEDPEEMNRFRDVDLSDPVEAPSAPEAQARPIQSRISTWLPRATPPSQPPPRMPTQMETAITSQAEAELREAEASRAGVVSELNNLVDEASTQQGLVNQAEERVTALQGDATAGEAVATAETAEASAETEAITTAGRTATLGAEGIAVEAGEAGAGAGASGAEAGASGATEAGTTVASEAGVEGAEGGFASMEGTVGTIVAGEDVGTGGPENPVGDVIAGATAVIGTIGAGIASIFGAGKPAQYNNISGTAVMSYNDITNAISKVKSKIATATQGTPSYNGLLALQNALTYGQGLAPPTVVSFKDAQGNPDIAVPLSNAQLATAIKVYQQNPNAYLGMSPIKLQVMGLSPEMAKGQAGATETSIGYIPTIRSDGATWTKGAGGGNWTNFYTAKYRSGIFSSNSNIDTLAVPDATQKKQMNDNYIAQVTQIINAETDPAVKAYLNYELNVFKYNNGYIPDKPTPVPKPTLSTAQEAQMTQLTDALNNKKAQLTAIQNSINTKQSIIDGINTQINNINAQAQAQARTDYQQQLQSYQTQANAYNQQVAQNIETSEAQTASYNIAYARATNTPLLAPTGKYLTPAQIQSFQQQLQAGQIKTTGVTPITTLTQPTIQTTASGSPIINQNALQTTSTPAPATAPVQTPIPVN